jgi:uncharacterized repeat protein (TIGR01451 family)
MKKIITLFVCLIWFVNAKAQYVTIPDAKFAAYLHTIVPTAMSGNQMDTTNIAVITLRDISVENDSIGDLTGVQYFDSLTTLDCGNGSASLSPNYLTSLPKLSSILDTLICGYNQLTSLPVLPSTLTSLDCYNNQLTNLPALPNTLGSLNCYFNQLTTLPALPSTLTNLGCWNNQLTSLPSLPNVLNYLNCDYNQISALPALPNSITFLNCNDNLLSNLPTLPNTLRTLLCGNNQLTSLILNDSLTDLWCYGNQLINLPTLPTKLVNLLCGYNQLVTLPTLPHSLTVLNCNNNQLASLPTLPSVLIILNCSNNNIFCFPTFPDSLNGVYGGQQGTGANCDLSNNPFSCLPNYVAAMDAGTLAYPLCAPGNANSCPNAQGIFGYTYKDVIGNCIRSAGDTNLRNIAIQIYDTANNLLGQTYSALNGVYNFPQTVGTYTVVIDTIGGVPFMAQCAHPGLDSTVTLTNIDTNINFSLSCKPGFDVGVLSTVANGLPFPGQDFVLDNIAGDISQWYNLNCAAGVSGQVQITVTGPVTFISPASGALTPAVGGNVYTYNIADYGTVNIMTAFNMVFAIDSSAQAGDLICVNIAVTPIAGDNNPSNNNYSFCFPVENSHDPNMKETYPVNVPPGYNNWFTYTIHFQNTGTATSLNIRLVDSLDANLDLKTFQVINYSNKNIASVTGNVLTFNFPNINLPDSVSNPAGSIGFVQYRVKPKPNLPAGTQIKNTAYIYFDYNAPVITDTTLNNFVSSSGINQVVSSNNQVRVYPNPSNGSFVIELNSTTKQTVQVYDINGKLVLSQTINGKTSIDASSLNEGVYNISLQSNEGVVNKRLVIVR